MINEMKILQDLLDKYKVTRPVPVGVRRDILAHKRRNFVTIMKKLDRYNPLLGAFLLIYFLLRKFGIIATLKQCGIILAVSVALTVAGISTGAYFVIKHALDTPSSIEMQKEKSEDNSLQKPKDEDKSQSADDYTSPPLRDVKNVIVFQPFDGMNASTGEISQVSGTIQNELTRIRGSKNIISTQAGVTNASTNLLLIGTVRKMGAAYAITAKVIDRQSGKIHFAATEESRTDTLTSVSKKLAKEISDNIE